MHTSLALLLERFPVLAPMQADLEAAGAMLLDAAQEKKLILIAGNGGSSADAEHIVGELMKSFVLPRPLDAKLQARLKELGGEEGVYIGEHLQQGVGAVCLSSHTALTSAFANDVDSSLSYAQQIVGYGSEGGVFWGISTSGNAKNVAQAALVAKAMGMQVLGLTGSSGGKLKELADVCLRVPESETYMVQELHLPIYHWLCIYVEEMLFGGP
ncbi:MAG TPA: SIS domain-containing protein [Sphaerochaeta sp.]|nr:SIS domain-containing protein [Sphaerochaeta sp.]